MKPIISVRNLSKKYIIGENIYGRGARTFRDIFDYKTKRLFQRDVKRSKEDTTIWALKDVSFDVDQGEVVGIIGRNGAGKSTLLKILSRITEPTEGNVTLRGRVASLLEVGTGFSGELIGRENIFLNGSILGMKRTEIKNKFDEIVAFAEVEKFIDTPVKRYSSGMYVRLAFAVAAHLEPEILLVDEVLAVGDIEFQRKCLGKMKDVAHQGRTVLFVSHNMAAVQSLCSSAFLLESGALIMRGSTDQVIESYLQKSSAASSTTSLADRKDRRGDGAMKFTRFRLMNDKEVEVPTARTGDDLSLVLEYVNYERSDRPAVVRIAFYDIQGQRLFMCLSRTSYPGVLRLFEKGEILCHIPKIPLLPGRYYVSLWCKLNEQLADDLQNAFVLDVVGGDYFYTGKLNPSDGGSLLVPHKWELR